MPENKLTTSSDKGQDNKTAAKTNEKSPDKDDNRGAEDSDIDSDDEEEEEAKEEGMSAEETQRQMDVALATRIHRIIVLSILPQLHGTITKKVFYMIFILSVKGHHIKSKSINQRKITFVDTTRQIFKDHEEKKIQQQQSLGSTQV